jgi:hypothetical protein
MKIVTFKNSKSVYPEPEELTWKELIEKLRVPDIRQEKDGACWSPVDYMSSNKRANKNVGSVHALVYDIDHATQQDIDTVRASLDVSAVMHSTFSDKPTDRCFRLIIPIDRPLHIPEFHDVRESVAARFGVKADPATKDPARIYYLPSRPDSSYEFFVIDGPILSQASVVQSLIPQVSVISARLLSVTKPGSKELARILLAGEPLATSNRDAAMQQAASILAWIFPELSTKELIDIAIPSIKAMPSSNTLDFELKKFGEKIERAKARKAKNVEETNYIASTLGAVLPSEPKSLDVVVKYASENNCTAHEFMRRWIIQVGSSYYIFVDGAYQYPIPFESLSLSLPRDLAKAPVMLYVDDKKTGKTRKRTTQELLDAYGTAARYIDGDMTLQKSYYDAKTQTFHEATCPLRTFEPVNHGDVRAWLTQLGGGDCNKLVDWLSSLTKLNRQSAALFLEGDSGSGKGLLATGIARLWVEGPPTTFDTLVSGWTSAVSRCPFIFADEGFPKGNHYSINDELRRWIGSQERMLTRKYLQDAPLRGSIRLMLAANNNRILGGFEEMSEQDRQAIAQRLIYIKVSGGAARSCLEALTATELDDWANRKIPETLMWLNTNHVVKPGKRFIVEGTETKMHDKLSIEAGLAPDIFDILCGELCYIRSPEVRKSYETKLVYGSGELLVTMSFFKDGIKWDKYCNMKAPKNIVMQRAVENVSSGTVDRNGIVYNKIRVDLFELWAEKYGGQEGKDALTKVTQ